MSFGLVGISGGSLGGIRAYFVGISVRNLEPGSVPLTVVLGNAGRDAGDAASSAQLEKDSLASPASP